MEESVMQFILGQWPAIVVLAIWGYFMVRYFMWVVEKKDEQNQANLERFISLVEKSNDVMDKSNLVIAKVSNQLDNIHPKLNEIHDDIKKIRDNK